MILAGVEVHRFGLRKQVVAFAERHKIPICSTLLSKSVVSELHPLYLGVYEGAMGRADMRRYVEDSDCLILLGAFMTDMDLGIYTAKLDPNRWIFASSEDLRIRHHHFHEVLFPDFVNGLLKAKIDVPARELPADGARPTGEVRAEETARRSRTSASSSASTSCSTSTRSSSRTSATRCSARRISSSIATASS